MRNIRLNDGSVWPVDRCAAANGLLYLRLTAPGITILTAAQAFDDPEKTARIEHYFDGTDTDRHVYEGLTRLIFLQWDGDAILLCLGQPE